MLRVRWFAMLALLGACETQEVKRLGQLKADLDRAIAERQRCAAEPECLHAQQKLDETEADLQRTLPREPPAEAFRQTLASRTAVRGLTLELNVGADLECRTPLIMNVLGNDDDAEAATKIALELPRVVLLDRAARMTSARRGWSVTLVVPRECRPLPQPPPEPSLADASAIPHSRWSGHRAEELRESIAMRAGKLAEWQKRTPYPAAVRVRREALLQWGDDFYKYRSLRAVGVSAAALMRSRLAAIDRITVEGNGVLVEGGGRLEDPRVAFGDGWTAALESAPAGRFRVRLIRKGG
jgi:hypothetical protein